MIGYKATYNYKCLDQTYEVGQEYKIDQPPKICKVGFHYCKVAKDVLTYYPIKNGFKLLEIEDLSVHTINDFNKSCSNHIRIVREITDSDELMQLLGENFSFDENTRTLKVNCIDGTWVENTFDQSGNELTFKNSKGHSYEYTRDQFGNVLTYKYFSGFSQVYTRDQFGNELTRKDSDGYSHEYTRDQSGNELTFKDSKGYSYERTYNSFGKLLTFKNSKGYSSEYAYDQSGNELTFKDSDGFFICYNEN